MLNADVVTALGMMSGTSLDGVDAAVIRTNGERIEGFGPTAYRPYTAAERMVLRAALGAWPGDADVDAAAEVVETAHAELVARFDGVALVGFHGQTLAHDPGGRGTHQTGSGAVLALVSGLPVVWDFRSSDVALGGQGAPLAPFFHFALARYLRLDAPVVFLNLGGVGNVTWVDPKAARPEDPGALLAFDTGPANAPMDDLMQARRGMARDEGGALAATGKVADAVVAEFLQQRHFRLLPPKSLDRDTSWLMTAVASLKDADALATLSACAAAAIGAAQQHFPAPPAQVLVSGGGRHNRDMMARIAGALDASVAPVETAGLDGDMIEAQAFAYLAVRVARGLATSCPASTGVAAAVGGGQISAP